MQNDGAFCNCLIDVDGTIFKVHLEILCASSEYFDNIIRRDSVVEDAVSLHNITPSTFSTLLTHLYTGRMVVNLSNLFDVYVAADFLILNSALDYCRKVLCENLRNEKSSEAFDVALEILSRYDDAALFESFVSRRNLLKRKDPTKVIHSSRTIATMPTFEESLVIFRADVEYRNIWTGERQMAPSPLEEFMLSSYEVKELELEEGETLSRIEVHSGWLVDKMAFVTSTGRYVGPFGYSNGGGVLKVAVNKCHGSRYASSEPVYTCLALHGFSYSLIRTQGCPSWFRVCFLYAAVEGRCNFTMKI
ncbi:unnamed protein product [Hydatigera taeniaeformis]|uniref:BTB domain-containing protein n=1 Tax=Hydatigena taeniaeformis TaxID=6205 RepID=A0A0R3X9A8_HYDTA|nr:unnamed protein product [Hydatigera taeniaeformis]